MAKKSNAKENKNNRQMEKLIGLVILIILAFAGGSKVFGCESVRSDASATVSFLDVGQGDSILIQTEEKTVLIDGGEQDQGSVVLEDLDRYGVTTIDYMIASHPHSDHIGGLVDVLEDAVTSDLTVSAVLLSEIPEEDVPTTRVYESFLDGVEANGLSPEFLSEEQTLDLGDGITLKLIPPPAGKEYSSLNDYSIAAYLDCGSKTFLFTGDAEEEEEEDWLESGAFRGIQADVFKAGHHGSRTSSSAAMLKQIQPTEVVISCGAGNSYGHPHEEALERLQEYCSKIYRTDLDGTVICTLKDGAWSWSFDSLEEA